MNMTKRVTINGQAYDARTGLPIDTAVGAANVATHTTAEPKTPSHATTIHHRQQKSTTLNRRAVRKAPVAHKTVVAAPPAPAQQPHKKPSVPQHTIARFAPRPVVAPAKTKVVSDIMPRSNPVVSRAVEKRQQHVATAAPKPAAVIKQQAIEKALATPIKRAEKRRLSQRFPRVFSVASASLAVLVLAGYLTYLNMPTISVRVAAVQAGIDASYPGYKPDGYRLDGPITYNDGHVDMKFASNAGPQSYTLVQQKSAWDSSAVLENYIKPKVGDDYVPYTEGGVTIYSYDGQAAWVNGGILYTIDGDALLSTEQIRRIATSL